MPACRCARRARTPICYPFAVGGILSIQAGLVLALWIPFAMSLFKKHSPAKAATIGFLGGVTFLPELSFFKFPLMPELEKNRLIAVALLLGLLLVGRARTNKRVEVWWIPMLILTFTLGIMIWRTNLETLYFGEMVCSGLNFKDGMYLSISALFDIVVVWVGMKAFRDERDLKDLLNGLVMAGLLCVPLILIELRFSPQVHRWVYGYHPHEGFGQTVRYGGYRPTVFMGHGLALSLFLLGTALAAVLLARFNTRVWKLSGAQASWVLTFAVIVCKSTGVWFYALFLLPMARWSSVKAMTRLALVIAVFTGMYPWLRATDRFPVEKILEYSYRFDYERGQSLQFRFDNEAVLLAHALEKPWFGWGGSYGRNRVYDEWGKDVTVTDGGWIIAFGNGGALGAIQYMGVPILCVFTVARRLKRVRDTKHRTMLAALNLYLAITWLDTLPNGNFNQLPLFLGGALCAISFVLSGRKRVTKEPKQEAVPASHLASRAPPAPAAQSV